tara:strand:- start:9 stop:254 length:246 start_codon:yes stop_codon:yes gene_type:complete
MTRYHLINGEKVAFTAAEETARDAEETAWSTYQTANAYKEERLSAYPSLAQQLDQLYWDKKNGTNNWVEAIDKVKSDNPKP